MAVLAAAELAFFSSDAQAPSTPAAATDAPSWGPVGAIYQQIARPGTAGRISAEAPLFAWATPQGQLTNLEALRGQPVVINFWATWCVPCREEMPALDRVAASRPDVVFLDLRLPKASGLDLLKRIRAYDPVAAVGGLLHVLLPEASLDLEKAGKNPCMFADTGLPVLLERLGEIPLPPG